MDAVQLSFLRMMKAAVSGQQLEDLPELNREQWAGIAKLAAEQKVVPMVYDAVRLLPQLAGTELLAGLRQQSRQQIVLQTRKTYDFLRLYEALRDAGVTPLVVKGIVCRNLYPQPDYRPSSDEDLLIRAEDFALCHEIFTRHGLATEATAEQMERDYEIPYRSTTGPLFIELHKSLFPPESEAYGDLNRFFGGVHGRAIQDDAVCTLPHTDHLFYLICHAFKHFLHSGFGIRQVCDIVLYANAYGSQIDWAQVLENCRAIRADKFAAAMLRIGSRHLVFDPEKACYPDVWREITVDETPMLEDLLCAGVYGSADKSRQHSSNITLNAVAAQKQGRKQKNAMLSSTFPPRAKLEGRYTYLKKHPYLLPVAWCSRLWSYSRETRTSQNNNAADALKIGSERVELLKEYGII